MRKLRLFEWILIGFGMGIIAGLIVGPPIAVIKPAGDLFVRLLKMIIVPLVFATIVVGVAKISPSKISRVFGKQVFWYIVTSIIAIAIGLLLVSVTGIGVGMPVGELATVEPKVPPPLSEVILGIVPTNLIDAMAKGEILPIIFFGLIFGVAISFVGKVCEPLLNVIDGIANAMYRVVRFILWYAPIGVFALIGWTVGTHGPGVLLPLASLIGVCWGGYIIHALGVYSLGLRFLAKVRPLVWPVKMKEMLVMCLATCSGAASLPVTMRCCEENAGISKEITGFVLPVGTTVNMDGTALYAAVCGVFLANAFGIPLGLSGNVIILFTALMASIGTAAVPGAGMIMTMMVLSAVGVPLEGIALIAGIDRILDMGRTAVNCYGDTVIAAIIAHSEGETLLPGINIGK